MIGNSLYSAPSATPQGSGSIDPIELEIDYPTDAEGNITIEIEPEDGADDTEFGANIADELGEDECNKLCTELGTQFETDLLSRQEWIRTYFKGLELLGLQNEPRSEPWPNACGVFHPMLTEAVVRFQSEVITETFPAMGPVKATIIGEETKENLAAATRVAEDMNYQLTDRMTEYRPEHEKMLWSLPLAGSAFKKVYYDETIGRQVSKFVPAEDVVIPYGASDSDSADRVTHVMRKSVNEIKKLMACGFYRELDVEEVQDPLDEIERERQDATGEEFSAVTDPRHRLLEIQVELDLSEYKFKDKFGLENDIASPYIVTIDRSTNQLFSIRRNYKEDDEKKLRMTHFVQYNYVPGMGSYGYGLIHLIGGYARAATSLTRQLVDAGTLSNLPGGLKTRGLRTVKGDDTPIGPGEWRDVEVPGGTIRDNLFPMPYKEPSQTLYQLLTDIIGEGKSFVNASELNVADMSGNAPVGTTLALLERQLKVMSAIQARMHYSMRKEFKLLKAIIKDCTDDDYDYNVEKADRAVKRADYDLCEVIPVSDPNASTMAHKVIQYQTVTQMAQQAPGIYDLKILHRQMIEVIGIKNADKLVPIDDDIENTDPVTENQNILVVKPVKAFLMQDHESHIKVHMALMQDPKIQQLLQANPAAQGIIAALQTHIASHIGYSFRNQVEQQMGITLPPEGQPLPPEMEVAMSRMAADATERVIQNNKATAAQEAAQQAAQDPMVQMQQQELAIKAKGVEQKDKEIQIKEKALVLDATHKADQTQLAERKLESSEKLKAMEIGARVAQGKAQMDNAQEATGLKAGIDIAKALNDRSKHESGVSAKGNPKDKSK